MHTPTKNTRLKGNLLFNSHSHNDGKVKKWCYEVFEAGCLVDKCPYAYESPEQALDAAERKHDERNSSNR